MSKLGIIAGGGMLPANLIAACQAKDEAFFVVAFQEHTNPDIVENVPHFWARLGATNKTIKRLKDEGVDRLVMAGAIRRPSLKELRPDWRTIKMFTKLGKAEKAGDDVLLRMVTQELEGEGFQVVGAHEVMADLLTPQGVLGRHKPSAENMKDITRGVAVALELGRQDVGQAAVVQDGIVLAVEAVEGTDAMLARCVGLKREAAGGGVLVKCCKPQQDERFDLPTIGPDTIHNAVAAGLDGVAIEAGRTILLDQSEAVKAADEAGLFVIGIQADSPEVL